MMKPTELLRSFEAEGPLVKGRIERGIEENRKGWLTLRFLDAENLPVRELDVKIEQLTHDFKFGANLFMLNGFETKEKNDQFASYFKELYNMAIVPFYWNGLEPEYGHLRFERNSKPIYRRPAPDTVLDFCEKHRIEPKGHTLVWHQAVPDWVPMDKKRVLPLLNERIQKIADRYADRIHSWDVVNEACERHWFPKVVMPEDYLYWSYIQAGKHYPFNRLFLNEATTFSWIHFNEELSPFYLLLDNLRLRGIPLGGIGMQYHLFLTREELYNRVEEYLSPARLLKVLDRYADFGIPIHISEVTLSAYGAAAEDEEVQAELLRNLYRLWFSHPAVEAIVYWNSHDGYVYGGEEKYLGGLFHQDFTPKPAYGVLRDLILNEWHTHVEERQVNESLSFRGFYGTYRVTAFHNGREVTQEVHLSKDNLGSVDIRL